MILLFFSALFADQASSRAVLSLVRQYSYYGQVFVYCASTAGQPPLGLYYGQVFVCASTSGQPLVGMYFVLIFIC